MSGLKSPSKFSTLLIELHAKLDKLIDCSRTLCAQNFNRRWPAQVRARCFSVCDVLSDCVIVSNYGGNATLRIVRVTFGEVGFGHQSDITRSARFNGRNETSDTAADNYNFFHEMFVL
jgi:hypothetical protein